MTTKSAIYENLETALAGRAADDHGRRHRLGTAGDGLPAG